MTLSLLFWILVLLALLSGLPGVRQRAPAWSSSVLLFLLLLCLGYAVFGPPIKA